MGHIRQIPPDEAEGLLKRVYDAGIGRSGSVAKIMQIMSQHPESLHASMAFYATLMLHDDGILRLDQREMLAAVVSNVNDCYY